MNYLFILVSVTISAVSQIILRHGMTRPDVQAALSDKVDVAGLARAVVLSPYVIGGLGLYGLGAILWLLVLSKLPVSSAYPFVALGMALTTAAGVVVLGEQISWPTALGVAVIIAGICLVAVGARA
ncbi:drug/metabolite transporter (DMT)-like permease [Rhizobium sp. SG_E_25_P2]|jgi:drug/metabolite transporter (DMT)-like permease|uniref:EamA family transporter n=1 Tax=Rhizobium sp. SG_E_25_P2 TaxID=2879942 RepID=UPI0024748EEC|nr:EamA family transporter [Rhizobium sp. SG_E_25_P2]MDH6268512.1 drug/metabolite transporter (DMT)-like permease [Rhizobium sp. SG_E_25_P2]